MAGQSDKADHRTISKKTEETGSVLLPVTERVRPEEFWLKNFVENHSSQPRLSSYNPKYRAMKALTEVSRIQDSRQ